MRMFLISVSLAATGCWLTRSFDGLTPSACERDGGALGGACGMGGGESGGTGVASYRDLVLGDMPLAYFRLGEAGATSPARNEVEGGPAGEYVNGVKFGAAGAIS